MMMMMMMLVMLVMMMVMVMVGLQHSGLALMGTTNAALSLRRFTQTSFNFRFNSALPPPVPVVSPPITPISRKSSLSTNG
uniref:Secreted protein n=1 Tax=Elaeophora elaphi TaxID=1147741 RepID=A0A0R3RNJ4_9BILA